MPAESLTLAREMTANAIGNAHVVAAGIIAVDRAQARGGSIADTGWPVVSLQSRSPFACYNSLTPPCPASGHPVVGAALKELLA